MSWWLLGYVNIVWRWTGTIAELYQRLRRNTSRMPRHPHVPPLLRPFEVNLHDHFAGLLLRQSGVRETGQPPQRFFAVTLPYRRQTSRAQIP